MSAKSKKRGYAVEKWLEQKHIAAGIPCERVPLSGLMGGKYSGDLAIPDVGRRVFTIESKARRNGAGFTVIEKWMEGKEILIMKRNHQEPLVILTFETYLKLMREFMNNERSRNSSV